jgi:Flp pilus assembly pilin Flp
MNRASSTAVTRLLSREDGQDLIEYGLLASLIALAAITAVSQLGSIINVVFWQPIAQIF